MTVAITGFGWINGSGAGEGRLRPYEHGKEEGRIDFPWRKWFSVASTRLGRMDTYTRLGIAAIALALRDARLEDWEVLRDIPVLASTVYGCLETDEAYYQTVRPLGGKLASPHLFAYTLPNTFLGEAAILFGLSGSGIVLQEERLKGVRGLEWALQAVTTGNCPAALAGLCDSGPRRSLGLKGRAVPGAVFFVLQREGDSFAPAYGSLTQGHRGGILFDGEEVRDLYWLAERCGPRSGKKASPT